MQPSPNPTKMRPLSAILFGSRWLQLPLYLGLIVAQLVYVVHFMKELVHLIERLPNLHEADIMLMVLGLIDVVMISNLLIMVIIGGYETFVSRLNLNGHPDEPDWLSHVNANLLKVKLAMSIIGISSIHLLKTFINVENLDVTTLKWQTIIHMAFIASAVSIAWIDRIMAHSDHQPPQNKH
ncbi:TIGR00645 family protein [Methylobacillus glycogenes]|uniref:TIGR00645 family protein n=1 Tax=Methylobacillus glycogenes TaxID=406 RepID=UPI00055FAD58|nr:TIGR00645 family protein [Methylobacillus glycogenes]